MRFDWIIDRIGGREGEQMLLMLVLSSKLCEYRNGQDSRRDARREQSVFATEALSRYEFTILSSFIFSISKTKTKTNKQTKPLICRLLLCTFFLSSRVFGDKSFSDNACFLFYLLCF